MYKKGILFIALIFILILGNSCGMEKRNMQEMPDADNGVSSEVQSEEEEINEIIYEDESHRMISYGDISFKVMFYHVIREVTEDQKVTFYCERDSDEGWPPEINKMVSIQDCFDLEVDTFEEAVLYFNSLGTYYMIESYPDIKDDSGITKIYGAIGDISRFLVYKNPSIYLIESDDRTIDVDLLKNRISAAERIYNRTVACAKGVTTDITENILYREREASYEISENGKIVFTAQLEITGEYPSQSRLWLFDSSGNEIQEINWEFPWGGEDNYPKFSDVNMDGMVDLQLVVDDAPSYEIYDFYIWNTEEMNYQKVEYDGVLAEIQVYDGYLLNWVKNGVNSYVIEKLAWNGNKLVKESEEIISADE